MTAKIFTINSLEISSNVLISHNEDFDSLLEAVKTNQIGLSTILKEAKKFTKQGLTESQLEILQSRLNELRSAKKEYYKTLFLGKAFKWLSKNFGSLSESKKLIETLTFTFPIAKANNEERSKPVTERLNPVTQEKSVPLDSKALEIKIIEQQNAKYRAQYFEHYREEMYGAEWYQENKDLFT